MMQQPYNRFEERRKYPRVTIKRTVSVYYKNECIDGEIHDISLDGLQVRCDRGSFQLVHPSGRFIRKENAPVVDVCFQLRIKHRLLTITARGLMYYFVVLPEGGDMDIAFGLKFISLDDKTVEDINAYIETAILSGDSTDPEYADEEVTQPKNPVAASLEADTDTGIKSALMHLLKKI